MYDEEIIRVTSERNVVVFQVFYYGTYIRKDNRDISHKNKNGLAN